jgi:hypothetical protein
MRLIGGWSSTKGELWAHYWPSPGRLAAVGCEHSELGREPTGNHTRPRGQGPFDWEGKAEYGSLVSELQIQPLGRREAIGGSLDLPAAMSEVPSGCSARTAEGFLRGW